MKKKRNSACCVHNETSEKNEMRVNKKSLCRGIVEKKNAGLFNEPNHVIWSKPLKSTRIRQEKREKTKDQNG